MQLSQDFKVTRRNGGPLIRKISVKINRYLFEMETLKFGHRIDSWSVSTLIIWTVLQSEVAELESSLKTAPSGGTVYLVPDAVALCTQLHLVRRLMASEKFVIIIPIQGTRSIDLPFLHVVTSLWKYFEVQERYQEINMFSSANNLQTRPVLFLWFKFLYLATATVFLRLHQLHVSHAWYRFTGFPWLHACFHVLFRTTC